ncbi:MAG: hypothetical protein CVV51_08175 [Spirochaetae bacterium HGW-Spirochaetae-7]|jgi:hypothetical protein|nr:MAG: hypothetical protein CVV51_08175 [Spirochaetae bacterium HGW-Spirochaetae-7]
MKRSIILAIALGTVALAARADDPRYVYEIRELDKAAGSAASQVWAMNVGIVAEAARLYVPVSFVKKSGAVSFTLDGTMSFSTGASVEVERSAGRILLRHEVSVKGAQPLPRADKRSTIRFSLSDIVRKGGKDSGSPLSYALRKAIDASSYKTGRAWVESAVYDGAGRFVIVVGLKKN